MASLPNLTSFIPITSKEWIEDLKLGYRIPSVFERSGLNEYDSQADGLAENGDAKIDYRSSFGDNKFQGTGYLSDDDNSSPYSSEGRIDANSEPWGESTPAKRFFLVPELFNMFMLQCLHHTTFPLPAVCKAWKALCEGAPRDLKCTRTLYTESILMNILGRLEMKELLTAESVCPIWLHAVASTPALQQRLFRAPSNSTTIYLNPAYSNSPSYYLPDDAPPTPLMDGNLIILTLLPPGHPLNTNPSPHAGEHRPHRRDLLEGVREHMCMTQPPTKLVKFGANMVSSFYIRHHDGVNMKQYSDALGEMFRLTRGHANPVRFSMTFYLEETDCGEFDSVTGKRKLAQPVSLTLPVSSSSAPAA